mgnify:CR=1 FL=1
MSRSFSNGLKRRCCSLRAAFSRRYMPVETANPTSTVSRRTKLEMQAARWIDEHPEYHAELADVDAALRNMHEASEVRDNPFLHLSMHLTISEQCSIDQPRGIRQAVELLTARRNSLHAAHHETMECLGQMVWESQSAGRPPDGAVYIDCVQRQATRD